MKTFTIAQTADLIMNHSVSTKLADLYYSKVDNSFLLTQDNAVIKTIPQDSSKSEYQELGDSSILPTWSVDTIIGFFKHLDISKCGDMYNLQVYGRYGETISFKDSNLTDCLYRMLKFHCESGNMLNLNNIWD
jgi:hypothetical protein